MFCAVCITEHDNPGQHGGYPTFPVANPYDTMRDIPATSTSNECDADGCHNVWQTRVMSEVHGAILLCFSHYRIAYAAN